MPSNSHPIGLSKSRLKSGLQCEKKLYLEIHQPDLVPPISPDLQATFDEGREVGLAAQKLYQGGVAIEAAHFESDLALQQTAKAMADGVKTLFEAAFTYQGVLVRVDILTRVGKSWDLLEVKMATDVKDEHLLDAAIQYWVLRGARVPVNRVFLMYLNREYVHPNKGNLFVREDVTDRIKDTLKALPGQVERIKGVVGSKNTPSVNIGPHCSDPHDCEFTEQCWAARKVPEISVFNVPGLAGTKKWELFNKGQMTLKSLVNVKLREVQRRMVDVTVSDRTFIDRKEIKECMADWEYPLYFLDFETINPALPRFTGTSPYDQVPFQFSCDRQDRPGGPLTHWDYLHETADDPRPGVIRSLLKAIGPKGSIVAYNKGFESGCCKALGCFSPRDAAAMHEICDRLVDPLPIMRSAVYHPDFAGSFSIKSVAPALLGAALSYEDMEVGDGGAAQLAYEELISPSITPARWAALKQAMLDYCRQDTLAMVKLVEWMTKKAT